MMTQPVAPAGAAQILWQAAHLLPRLAGSTVTDGDVVQALVAAAARHFPVPQQAQQIAQEALSRLGSYVLVQCGSPCPTLRHWLDGCSTRTAAWAMKAAAERPLLPAISSISC